MREILFRGKRLEIGSFATKSILEWVYGGYANDCSGSTYIYDNTRSSRMVCVDPKTVCQYTGLTDKTGKRIFEGDICKYFNQEDRDGVAIIREDYAEWVGGTIRQKHIMTPLFYLNCSEEWEVIGNIFDNPDLL